MTLRTALAATAACLLLTSSQASAQFLPPAGGVNVGGASPRAHQMKGDARNVRDGSRSQTARPAPPPARNTTTGSSTPAPEIHRAAADGRVDQVQDAITRDPSLVRNTDSQGFTPLHHAAVSGHAEVVQTLLDGGAMVDMTGSRGETALYLAASKGYADVVKTLLAAGADVNRANSTKTTPLHKAAMAGDLATVKALLAGGADRTAQDRSGRTAQDLAERYRAGDYNLVISELQKD